MVIYSILQISSKILFSSFRISHFIYFLQREGHGRGEYFSSKLCSSDLTRSRSLLLHNHDFQKTVGFFSWWFIAWKNVSFFFFWFFFFLSIKLRFFFNYSKIQDPKHVVHSFWILCLVRSKFLCLDTTVILDSIIPCFGELSCVL